jgi:hypothetical protein
MKIILLRCDPTQIAAADRNSSVFLIGQIRQVYPINIISYTIDGGPSTVGSKGPTNLQVLACYLVNQLP